tara:strand:+ start:156 stop:443 length:288 start_codon:yes stop_codon:yes gene_type:complete
MILLNACSTRKIVFNGCEEFQFFSLDPNPPKDFQMHHFNDIIVDSKTADFLREYPIEWVRSEDKSQILAVKVEADKDVCRKFVESIISVNAEKFL